MATATHTLTLPVHPAHLDTPPSPDWRRQWRYEADTFAQALGPKQGITKIALDHDGGTVTVEYNPNVFSLDQLQALGREMGLVVGGAVYHTILDLPQCGRRAALARELEERLQSLPGVARANLNPLGRTLTVEYLGTAPATPAALIAQMRQWGLRANLKSGRAEWWVQNQLLIYSAVCALTLTAAWLGENVVGAARAVWIPAYALAYLAGGGVSTLNALNALRRRQIDVDLLMVAAALGAGLIGNWAEGGMLLFLFSLSNALEHYAMDRTRQAIRALMNLRPATARLLRGASVPVEQLVVGDVLDVRPGERLPADGSVTAGESAVDQSPITGESIPVPRGPGQAVFAGSINGGGALEIRVTKRAQDSTLARIILLVEEAQSERAPTQRRLDELEQRYAVGVIGFSALVGLSLPLLWGWTAQAAFYKAMTVLVVASPCALVISTPASLLSAIAAGARQGVLFKGGAHVESLARIRVVAFDKTGTLTVGRPQVTDVRPRAAGGADELLALAAAVEARSEHPLARAVVTAAQARGLALPQAAGMQAVSGKGVTAQVAGRARAIHLGTPDYLREHGILVSAADEAEMIEMESQGKTVILAGEQGGALLGLIAVADTVRPEARAAVAALKAAGIKKVVMLTGDNQRAALAIGAQAGVDEVRAELLPEDKVSAIKNLLKTYGAVAMVGDGVNDAPALALASVGIAMGAGGSDVALETADVVLMSSDLSKLPYAIGLSRRAMRVVGQNLTFALAVIAALVASTFLNLVSLPLGVVGHEGSTVIVVTNGLTLLGYRPSRETARARQLHAAPAAAD